MTVARQIPAPSSDEPSRQQVTTLDGVDYKVRFLWCSRTEMWTFDLYTAAGEPLLQGATLVPNRDIIRTLALVGRPPGKIAVYAPDGAAPDLSGWASAELLYVTEE